MTKSEFIQTYRDKRAELDAALSKLSEDELTRRDSADSWSIKDNLAHLTFWEQFMLNNVRQAVRHDIAPTWMNDVEETETNARILRDNWDRPLADLLAEMRQSLAETLAELETLSEDDLFNPNRFAWLRGKPLWTYIANEGYGEHYHEHLPNVKRET
jgi:hypothetical protein